MFKEMSVDVENNC